MGCIPELFMHKCAQTSCFKFPFFRRVKIWILSDFDHFGSSNNQDTQVSSVYKLNEELQRGVYPCTTATWLHGCNVATLLQPCSNVVVIKWRMHHAGGHEHDWTRRIFIRNWTGRKYIRDFKSLWYVGLALIVRGKSLYLSKSLWTGRMCIQVVYPWVHKELRCTHLNRKTPPNDSSRTFQLRPCQPCLFHCSLVSFSLDANTDKFDRIAFQVSLFFSAGQNLNFVRFCQILTILVPANNPRYSGLWPISTCFWKSIRPDFRANWLQKSTRVRNPDNNTFSSLVQNNNKFSKDAFGS